MNKLFNTIAKIVEINNNNKATVVVENVKLKFTEKSVIGISLNYFNNLLRRKTHIKTHEGVTPDL